MVTNWDKDKPLGTQKIRLSDEEIRANFAALEDAIARNHNFPGNEGSDAGEHAAVECQDQAGDPATPASVIAVYNNGDALFAREASSGTISALGGVPSGTKMLFVQGSAPTGWTFDASNNDRVLINQSTVGNGGTTGGSWTISGVTVDGHAVTIAEMPAHSHPTGLDTLSGGAGQALRPVGTGSSSTGSTGGGGTHTHGLTSDAVWRPAWLGVITCTKD